ncbi:MAG: hemolysin [Chloroflexi bacterium HGW-Chloroflexi-10]|nr:MAG: hemolysin [Chloroflexi bacterium HGW-Chloroflexi-10]
MNLKFREPVSALTHLSTAAAALIGTILLLIFGQGDLVIKLSLLIYGISLVLMFASSGVYHGVVAETRVIQRLRKMDHSAIYLLIAGSYTPICLYFFQGFWQWGMLAIIWGFGIIGIVVKLFVINAPRWITAGVYLVMGWLSIMAVQEIIRTMPPAAIFWLITGGLFYSIGAIIYITKKMDLIPGVFGFHEVWHIFVILGALSHFILIAVFVAAA